MHEESIEIPLPRSLLATSFTIDPASTTQFSNNTRDESGARTLLSGLICMDMLWERSLILYYADKHEYEDFKFAWDCICRPARNLDCKYTSAGLDLYHQEVRVTSCWGDVIPDRRIDYLMEHVCEPEITGMKMSDEDVTVLWQGLIKKVVLGQRDWEGCRDWWESCRDWEKIIRDWILEEKILIFMSTN